MQILIQPQKEQRMEFAISLAAVLKYILIFFLKATNRIEHFATDILFFFFFGQTTDILFQAFNFLGCVYNGLSHLWMSAEQ